MKLLWVDKNKNQLIFSIINKKRHHKNLIMRLMNRFLYTLNVINIITPTLPTQ